MSELIQDEILEYLYRFDKEKAHWTTKEQVARIVRGKTGADRNEIKSDVDFLVGQRFIQKKIVRVGKMSSEKIKISSKGISLFENTKYSSKPFSPIQLQGGNNVIILGDNNDIGHIEQIQGESIAELNNLIAKIKFSSFSSEEKMNLIGDIETLKGQLLKSKPTNSLMSSAWNSIKLGLSLGADASGFHDLVGKIGKLLDLQ